MVQVKSVGVEEEEPAGQKDLIETARRQLLSDWGGVGMCLPRMTSQQGEHRGTDYL